MTQSSGAGQSAYGYTGEQQSNDMVYLRARYYSPLEGRFLSRDTWGGDGNKPITLNRWVYANANPIRYIDPSGNSAVQSIISNALRRAGVGSSVPGGINSYGINCSSTGGEPPYWFYFAIGTLDQYLEDMTIGIFQADDNYNHIQVYQQGRNFGHSVSLTQAMIETIIGLALAEAALSSIPPTLGGGSLCAGVTGGGCIVIALPVVGVEVIVLVGASLINLHGAAMIARAASDGGGGGGGGGGLIDGSTMSEDEVLEAAKEFLGPGYKDMGNGRLVSADGLRQVRIGDSDVFAARPHVNFETLAPNPANPGKMRIIENIHIYLEH